MDVRYATANNFVGKPVYTEAKTFSQRDPALAVVRVNQKLKLMGYGLLIFDGYRPWSITKILWDVTSKENKIFVANPKEGSKHNRGYAIDLSLYDLKTGKEIEMTGSYDEMTERSFPNYTGGSEEQRKTRDLLRAHMEGENFTVDEYEWWHFNYNGWKITVLIILLFLI